MQLSISYLIMFIIQCSVLEKVRSSLYMIALRSPFAAVMKHAGDSQEIIKCKEMINTGITDFQVRGNPT